MTTTIKSLNTYTVPQTVLSNATITSSDYILLNGNYTGLDVVINITNAPTGFVPIIQFYLQDVDPGDSATGIGTRVSSSQFSAASTQTISLINSYSGITKLSWTVSGTSPKFTGVYVTVTPTGTGILNTRKQLIQTNATITSGSSSIVNVSTIDREVDIFVNVSGQVSGVNPTLQLVVSSVDPGDGNTVTEVITSGSVISSVSAQTITITNTSYTSLRIDWVVAGISPRFTGVFITVVSKALSGVGISGAGGAFAPGGDLTGTTTNQTVAKLQGSTLAAPISSGSANKVLHGDSSGTLHWSQVDLTADVTGTLPSGNQSPQTVGGDLSGTTTTASVIKIQGNAVKAEAEGLSQDGYVLTWVNTNSRWEAKPSAGGGTAGGDLSGTYPNPTVAKINGSSVPTGGALTIGNVLQVSGSSSLTYGPVNLAGGSNYVTGNLPSTNIAPGTAGQIFVTNSTPASSWTSLINYETVHGRLTSGGGGSDTKVVIGPYAGNETSYSSVYLLPNATSPGLTNYALLGDGSSLYINSINSGGSIFFRAANIDTFAVNSSVLTSVAPTFIWAAATASPTITQYTPVSDVAPQNLTLKAQPPFGGATINPNAGDVVVQVSASQGATPNKFGGLQVQYNSTVQAVLGTYLFSGANPGGGLWLGTSANAINYNIWGSSAETRLNGPSGGAVNFMLNNTQVGSYNATSWTLGGSGTTSLNFVAGGTTFGTMTNSLWQFGTSTVQLIGPTLQFAAATASPTINQQISSTGAGQTLTISAQSAKSGSTAAGGELALTSGITDGTGWQGYVQIFPTSTWIAGAGSNFAQFTAASWNIYSTSLSWNSSVGSPLINQADLTTASGTGQTLTVQAQNETGVTSTGGSLILASGTGTTIAGNVTIKTGSTNQIAITPTTVTMGVSSGSTTFIGSNSYTTKTFSGTGTIDTTTTDYFIFADTSSGPFTLTLPTPTNGRKLIIKDKKQTFSANNLTIARHGSEKIDGATASLVLSINNQQITIESDGTDWYTTNAASTSIGGSSNSVIIPITQTTHGFSTGQVVYFNGTSWALAEANNANTLGIGIVSVIDSNHFNLYQDGYIYGLVGLTAGQYYFVSDAVAGSLTATEPVTIGNYSNPILFAISTTTGIVIPFRPSMIGSGSISAGSFGALANRITATDGYTQIHWTMDETAAPWANTGVGGTLNLGTQYGSPLANRTGLFTQAVDFNANSGIITGDTSIGESATAFTISFWVYLRSFVGTQELVDKKYQTGNTWNAPWTSFTTSTNGTSDGAYSAGITIGGTRFFVQPAGANGIPVAQWTLISITFDGLNIRAYTNGNLAGTTAASGSIDWGSHGPWQVGAIVPTSSASSNGMIEDIRVENVVRSQAYFESMYKNGIALFDNNVSFVGAAAGGDLAGTYPHPSVVGIQGKTLSSSLSSVGAAQDGYALTWVNANNDWEAKPSSGIASGGNTTYAGYGAPVTLHNIGDLYYDLSQFPAQGYVQENVALPPTFNGSLSGTFSTTASFTSGTFTCGSTCKLLVAVIMFQQSTDQSVTSVTSTGLTFTRHNFVDNGGANSRFTRIEVWTAPVSSALSQTIGIALSGAIDDASVYFFGLNNVNATAFDASADITGFNATGVTSLSLTGVSTSNANDLLLYAVGANATGPPAWAPATGFSKLTNVYNAGGSQWSELQLCYQSRTATLSSTSINTGVTTAIAAAAISFAVQGPAASVQWVQFGTPPMPVTTVANLPTTPAVGQRQVVIDSTTATFNAVVGGGSTSTVTVWWNGSNWVVG